MARQQTKLTLPVRRGIMLFLIACFFIISPLIIMYTAGYRYDFAAKQIKQTGVISIDIKPDDTQIFLNGVAIKKKIPVRLSNRAPGVYTIKFTKPGYQDWQKEVTVESKKTTYLKNITLFKNSLPIIITDKLKYPLIDAAFSTDGAYALFITKITGQNNVDNIYEINLLATNSKKITPILRTDSISLPLIFWSPYNNFALIQTNNNGKRNFDLLDPNNLEDKQNFSYPASVKEWQWSKNNFFPSIYIQNDNKLQALNNNKEKILTVNSSTPWYVDNEENIWGYNNDKQQLIKNNVLYYELKNTEEIKKIINIDKQQIILQGNNNIFVIEQNNNEKQLHILSTRQIYFNAGTKEWLSWSPWELWTIYENGSANLLTRTSEKIYNVLPLDKYGVLLLQTENNIKGFNPGYYITHELLNNIKTKKISVDTENRKIFFWGEAGQKEGLFELKY